jgi:hypothetical protein
VSGKAWHHFLASEHRKAKIVRLQVHTLTNLSGGFDRFLNSSLMDDAES